MMSKSMSRSDSGGSPSWLGAVPDLALASAGALLLWLSQPPLGLSLFAWVAMVPWVVYAMRGTRTRRELLGFLAIAMLYWLVTMQGIRHAHPAMYAVLFLFAFYLACYSVVFILMLSSIARSGGPIPIWLAVPVVGTGLEAIRNYLLTGVSAVMLGHTQVNHSSIIQLADAFGSYGVTFLILSVNGGVYHALSSGEGHKRFRWAPLGLAGLLVIASIAYGTWRLEQAPTETTGVQIALLARNEEIIFLQDAGREMAIFEAYFRQSEQAARQAASDGKVVDVIVWPESMFTGSLPWLLLDPPSSKGAQIDPEFAAIIQDNQEAFQRRGAQIQAAIRQITGQPHDPHLIVGCGVVRYNDPPRAYSGIVHLGEKGKVLDWYGKTHLVMFGEYIPLIEYLTFLHRIVPPGMGVSRGEGAKSFPVSDVGLVPNICIETAVERVAPRHVAELMKQGKSADAIVNVTNDGWFDRSSVVEHHLRCSQFVAVTSRRPVLIAANGGPTAWIDGSGRIVSKLKFDAQDSILADFAIDNRWGLYRTIGDWPARLLGAFSISMWLSGIVKGFRQRGAAKSTTH